MNYRDEYFAMQHETLLFYKKLELFYKKHIYQQDTKFTNPMNIDDN